MKKLFIAFALLIAFFTAQSAFAAATQNITITISINAVASLTIDSNTWSLTNSSFSSSYVSNPYLLTNDGTVNETYKVQGANSTGTHPWTMAAGTGVNQFTTQGLIGAGAAIAPAGGDFAAEDALNNATYVTATATDLGNVVWSATNGADVAPAATRRLYLRLQTPTGGYASAGSIGTVTITVSADVL
jgi:hypothetical protein